MEVRQNKVPNLQRNRGGWQSDARTKETERHAKKSKQRERGKDVGRVQGVTRGRVDEESNHGRQRRSRQHKSRVCRLDEQQIKHISVQITIVSVRKSGAGGSNGENFMGSPHLLPSVLPDSLQHRLLPSEILDHHHSPKQFLQSLDPLIRPNHDVDPTLD